MEKLQLGRKRKTDAEKPRMDPLMRALKALHSAGSPEAMTPEELEHQRRNQEILGRLTAPMAGMEYEELSIGAMPAAWTRLKAPYGTHTVKFVNTTEGEFDSAAAYYCGIYYIK